MHEYVGLLREQHECKEAFRRMGVTRMCCKRMLMSHPPHLEETMMQFPACDYEEEDMFMKVDITTRVPLTVGTS
jgi:DNA-directed RNA polymerase subunit N (RpoN/RPB10)|tara:strand:+ start:808 stop:1029 length:222 start_codon:yes stop_codon:yes gene_type:complete